MPEFADEGLNFNGGTLDATKHAAMLLSPSFPEERIETGGGGGEGKRWRERKGGRKNNEHSFKTHSDKPHQIWQIELEAVPRKRDKETV
eukprot:1157845-Pelagomonas_calceolata.AAC.12